MVVDPWLLKAGPWGIARAGLSEIRGFTRWRGRIWRRVPGDPMALPVDGLLPPVVLGALPKPTMHWTQGPFGAPACRAPGQALTTIEYDAMTTADEHTPWLPCQPCLEIAAPMVLQYLTSTR